MTKPSDPLYNDQWHLSQIGHLETAWNYFTGNGVRVVVYDDGIEAGHEDLAANYDPSGAFSYLGKTYGSAPVTAADRHGTAVAGLIAADNNGKGGVGVAYDASIASTKLLAPVSSPSLHELVTVLRHAENFDIMNNSWGYTPDFAHGQSLATQGTQSEQMALAFADISASGRGGLGTIIVNAAGNQGLNANGEGVLADRHVITVGAIDSHGSVAGYSNWGTNLLVSAPAANYTTDRTGNAGYNAAGIGEATGNDSLANTSYTSVFGGTSASAPMVTGVAALMLEADPTLGWRDVHNILAMTASHVGSSVGGAPIGNELAGWQVSNSGHWNGGGMGYSIDYGYGKVNALAAASLASVWHEMIGDIPQTSANEESVTATNTARRSINDTRATVSTVHVGSDFQVESVLVRVVITHTYAPDLTLTLIAPDGTEFPLFVNDGDATTMDVGFNWSFGVEGARGLSSAGDWKLRVEDDAAGDNGTLYRFQVTVTGSQDTGNEIHTFTDDFMAYRAVDAARATVMSTSAQDWLNFAPVSGNIHMTLAAGEMVQVDGIDWTRLAAGSTFTRLATGSGNDRIGGSSSADWIDGGIGNDVIHGYDGSDVLRGGFGDDTLSGGNDDDEIVGGAGKDHVDGGLGRDLVMLGDGDDTFIDTHEAGLQGSDTVLGENGNDLMTGWGGNDVFWGGTGNDTLIGGRGNDQLHGGVGDDVIEANDGDDHVYGGGGNDNTWLGLGNDYYEDDLTGSAMHDNVYGGAGNDTIDGGGGDDMLNGGSGQDSLIGGTGNDRIYAGDQNDRILAGAGDDKVLGGNGSDYVQLGDGNDNYYDFAAAVGPGKDSVWGGAGNDTIFGGDDDDSLQGDDGNDILRGGDGADRLLGGNNDDQLIGGFGNDTLNGGAGDDVLAGDGGADLLHGSSGSDRFVFHAHSGIDRVNDFANDVDTLAFSKLLWGGVAHTAAQVIADYATVVGNETIFDFGAGNKVMLAGVTNLHNLIDDVLII